MKCQDYPPNGGAFCITKQSWKTLSMWLLAFRGAKAKLFRGDFPHKIWTGGSNFSGCSVPLQNNACSPHSLVEGPSFLPRKSPPRLQPEGKHINAINLKTKVSMLKCQRKLERDNFPKDNIFLAAHCATDIKHKNSGSQARQTPGSQTSAGPAWTLKSPWLFLQNWE